MYTDNDKILFNQAETCHICDRKLGGDKVRDHRHITGKFRSAAHNKCNLKFHLSHRYSSTTWLGTTVFCLQKTSETTYMSFYVLTVI